MSWWSWILIWAGLVLLLVGVLLFFGWRLFRKGQALLRETGELTAKMNRLAEFADVDPEKRPRSSLFADYEQVRHRRENRRERRHERVADRRAARIRRGKLLVHRNPIAK